MDSIKSLKGYGKVDEAEQLALQKRRRRRLIFIIVSSVLLTVIVGVVAGTLIRNRKSSSHSPKPIPTPQLTPAMSLKELCSVTQYPTSCYSTISSLNATNTTDPKILFKLSLHVAIDELSKLATELPTKLIARTNNSTLKSALGVCKDLLEDGVDRLNDSMSSMEVGKGGNLLSSGKINDMKTWLSTSITDQETCLDSLRELNSSLVDEVETAMQNSTEFASNSLAIVAKVLGLLADFNIPIHGRKLLGLGGEFPDWISAGDRRLLGDDDVKVNLTVAKDGSGDYKTISEAVAKVPNKTETRFVIYVKEGNYSENVILDKNKWNVMIFGDGKTKTIVSGNLNFVDGTPTFSTATFAVAGKGFIGKEMGFFNTAGPEKHQAVAFRSGSDLSVLYNCAFNAFQDTLYAHSNRQFYRDCDITGTIDFIFGNAAVVFQNCNIQPRQPLANQFNTITAQGKKDPNQNTGISIQKSNFSPLDNLTATTYLGRPWKEYSTTVIMQSDIGKFLHPLGWKEWVSEVEPPNTIFYAEYQNTGPGSAIDNRVTWGGYKPTLTSDEASRFSVDSFIQGSDWIPATNTKFDASL